MRYLTIACGLLVLFASVAGAGVVVEVEIDAVDEPELTGSEVFYAQGEMTRTDSPRASGESGSVIFRDDTMYFLDHKKKLCQKISKRDVDELSDQLDALMKQLEQLPSGQREMMQKMMKKKLPGGQEPPTYRVETGGQDRVGPYTCTVYTAYSNEDKVRDVCMADESVGADIAEAMGAFHALAEFAEGLMKVAGNMPFADAIDMPFQELDEAQGFPVRTRVFDGEGKVTLERTLRSITRREIEPETFEVPKGYKVKSLGKELSKKAVR